MILRIYDFCGPNPIKRWFWLEKKAFFEFFVVFFKFLLPLENEMFFNAKFSTGYNNFFFGFLHCIWSNPDGHDMALLLLSGTTGDFGTTLLWSRNEQNCSMDNGVHAMDLDLRCKMVQNSRKSFFHLLGFLPIEKWKKVKFQRLYPLERFTWIWK